MPSNYFTFHETKLGSKRTLQNTGLQLNFFTTITSPLQGKMLHALASTVQKCLALYKTVLHLQNPAETSWLEPAAGTRTSACILKKLLQYHLILTVKERKHYN